MTIQLVELGYNELSGITKNCSLFVIRYNNFVRYKSEFVTTVIVKTEFDCNKFSSQPEWFIAMRWSNKTLWPISCPSFEAPAFLCSEIKLQFRTVKCQQLYGRKKNGIVGTYISLVGHSKCIKMRESNCHFVTMARRFPRVFRFPLLKIE